MAAPSPAPTLAELCPMLLCERKTIPPGPGWHFEIKLDGYWLLAATGSAAAEVPRGTAPVLSMARTSCARAASLRKKPDAVAMDTAPAPLLRRPNKLGPRAAFTELSENRLVMHHRCSRRGS